MSLVETLEKIIVFITRSEGRNAHGVEEIVARATGFLIGVDVEPGIRAVYMVTAGHVARKVARGDHFVRFNRKSGDGCEDIPLKYESFRFALTGPGSKETDLAACLLDTGRISGVTASCLAIDHICPDHPDDAVAVGDETVSMSLFRAVSGTERMRPALRFGHIAMAPPETMKIEVDRVNGIPEYTDAPAYLVEAHSWNGQSGAPVFVFRREPTTSPFGFSVEENAMLIFLGINSAHWDMEWHEKDSHERRVNSGMATVIPATAVKALLMEDEDILAEREAWHERVKARRRPGPTSDGGRES